MRFEINMSAQQCSNKYYVLDNSKIKYNKLMNTTIEDLLQEIERLKIEISELKKNKEVSEIVVSNTTDNIAILSFDLKAQYLYVSPSVKVVFGYDPEDLIGKSFFDFIHNDDKKTLLKLLKTYLKNIEKRIISVDNPDLSEMLEFRFKDKTGEWRHLQSRINFIGHKLLAVTRDVSDQKRVERELWEKSEKFKSAFEQFRLMADTTTDMIWSKDMEGNFTFANKALCDKLINAKDVFEPIGKHVMFFVNRERESHKDQKDWFTFGEECGDSDAITLERKETCRFTEYGNVFGKYLCLDVYKSPIWNSEGKLIGTVGSARDITQQVIMERTLKESERKFRELFEKTNDAILILENGKFIECNQAALELFGYKDYDEIINLHPYELSPEKQDTINFSDKLADEMIKAALKKGWHRFNWIHRKKNGSEFPAEILLTTIVNEKDRKRIHAVVRDISKRKQAENNLMKLNEDLAVQNEEYELLNEELNQNMLRLETLNEEIIKEKNISEENKDRLETFINTIPDIVCYKDGHGRWLMANDADLKLFSLDDVDYYGKTDAQLAEYTHPIYRDAFLTCMQTDEQAWEKNEVSHGIEIIPTIDNGEKYYDVYKIPTFTPDGKRKALAVIGRDISVLQKTKENLIEAKEKAEESDRLKSAFLANISHEIRTPMNGILGFASLLDKPDLTDDQIGDYASIIQKSGKRMLNIINDIVDISKIESGQMEIKNTEINLSETLTDLYAFFLKEAHEKELKLVLNIPKESILIFADKTKLTAIITNLLKNALKYTKKGLVELGAELNENGVEIYVKDSGIGIPKGRLNAVFDRFVQADIEDKHAKEGAGLGLAISKAYAELMGGNLSVESVLGQGSTFKLALKTNSMEVKNKDLPLTEQFDYKPSKSLNIIIAEDESYSDTFLSIILKDIGKKIFHARTGIEVLEILKNEKNIDLILMDLKMPVMNGYIATEEIRKFNKDIIIIAQTAYALSGDRERAMNAGCNDYLSKPFTVNEVLDLLSRYFS
jgi:PAS domain S-box-containing protein